MMQHNQQTVKSVEDTSLFARQRQNTIRIQSLSSRLHTLLNLVLNAAEGTGDAVKASSESLDNFHHEQNASIERLEADVEQLGLTLMGQQWQQASITGINNEYRKQV